MPTNQHDDEFAPPAKTLEEIQACYEASMEDIKAGRIMDMREYLKNLRAELEEWERDLSRKQQG